MYRADMPHVVSDVFLTEPQLPKALVLPAVNMTELQTLLLASPESADCLEPSFSMKCYAKAGVLAS